MRNIQDFICNQFDGAKGSQSSILYRYRSGFSLLDSDRRNHKNIARSLPPCRSIKVNFDAAISTNKTVIDYVIKNYHGDLILAANKSISLFLISYVEIVAA